MYICMKFNSYKNNSRKNIFIFVIFNKNNAHYLYKLTNYQVIRLFVK